MPVTVTCYGGVREIGGNKILLEDGGASGGGERHTAGGRGSAGAGGATGQHARGDSSIRRVLLDFGQSMERHKLFFDGILLTERTGRGLLDPVALGLVPPLRGLLREDMIPVLDGAHLTVTEIPPTGRQKNPRQEVEVSSEAAEQFWAHWQKTFPAVFRDLRRASGPAVDFLLLSHAHLDHVGDVQYVDTGIPAYSTRLTAVISKSIMDSGQLGRSGAPYSNPCKCGAEGILRTDSEQPLVPRPWGLLDGQFGARRGGSASGDAERVGATRGGSARGDAASGGGPGDSAHVDSAHAGSAPVPVSPDRLDRDRLESADTFWETAPSKCDKGPVSRPPAPAVGPWLKSWSVDHSLMGAAAFAVETGAGWVAYTGDLRFHGGASDSSHKFATELAKLRPVALLCEGTRLSRPPENVTEEEAYQNCLKVTRRAEGKVVVADFAARHVERLMNFTRVAAECKRTLLLQPKDAYLLRAMNLADPDAVPDVMEDACVGLYADPKASPQEWERSVVQRYSSRRVGPREVQRSPGDFILALSLFDMADMLDIQFLKEDGMSGVYIFSNSPAFDDEYAIDLKRLMHWVDLLNLEMVGLKWEDGEVKAVRGYHASGHASRQELVEFVKQVSPRMLIPVHTDKPEIWETELAGTGIKIFQPEAGKPIPIQA